MGSESAKCEVRFITRVRVRDRVRVRVGVSVMLQLMPEQCRAKEAGQTEQGYR